MDNNFGFKQVTSELKSQLVNQVFDEVANQYDLMNDFMSLGIHRYWKQVFCAQILDLNAKILDMAGGTGDIALRLKQKARKLNASLDITVADPNANMLKICQQRAIDQNFLDVHIVETNAEQLPFVDNSFDYYTISFGIRNVASIEQVLAEAYRVLKPTGKFICLEFSTLNHQLLQELYRFYSFRIIPLVGKIITNNSEAYRYLAESISLFPKQEQFKHLIEDAGFSQVSYQNLTSGIVAIHSGYKI